MSGREDVTEGMFGFSKKTKRTDGWDLSHLPKPSEVECLFSADWHLSHTPPVARSCEGDWYGVMKRCLQQVDKIDKIYQKPHFMAGDLFDKWNPPSQLVNFTIENLKYNMFWAIPGNHDLPNHSYEELEKTGFHTLSLSGKVLNADPYEPTIHNNLHVFWYPYGFGPTPYTGPKNSLMWDIAVIHDYIWTDRTGYEGAPEDKRLSSHRKNLQGFDVAVFGDNHQSFVSTKGDPVILNCGSLFRRNIDQIDHKPAVWLLTKEKKFIPAYLDTREDKFIDKRKVKEIKRDMKQAEEFITHLKGVGSTSVDFEEQMERYLRKKSISEHVRLVILAAMEEARNV